MEQGKYIFHSIKAFILYHKALSIVIACAIILDISLIGVITDIQNRELHKAQFPTKIIQSSPLSR
jgi:hypothetical protein